MRKNLKRIASIVLVVALMAGMMCVPTFAASSDINVTVNGKAVVWTDAKPFIDENNRTLVPLRAVADAMGLVVQWDKETRTASFTKEATVAGTDIFTIVCFTIGESTFQCYMNNGLEIFGDDCLNMDTAAVIVNGRTYAPIRYLSMFFDYEIDWDAATKTVVLEGGCDKIAYRTYYDDYNSGNGECFMMGILPYYGFENLKSTELKKFTGYNGEDLAFRKLSDDEVAEYNSDYQTCFLDIYVIDTYLCDELEYEMLETMKSGESELVNYVVELSAL